MGQQTNTHHGSGGSALLSLRNSPERCTFPQSKMGVRRHARHGADLDTHGLFTTLKTWFIESATTGKR